MNGEEPQQYETPAYEQQPIVEYAAAEEAPKKFEVRTLALVIGAIILAVIIIIGAFMIVRSMQRGSAVEQYEQEVVASAEARLADDLSECEEVEDPAACEARVVSREASKVSAVAVCEMLEDKAFVNCVESVARERSQPDDCEAIEEKADREKCHDRILLPIVSADRDYARCDEMISDQYKETCQAQILPFITGSGLCAEYEVDQSLCDTEEFIMGAVTARNPDLCLTLSIGDQGDCLDKVGNKDIDLDGVSEERENRLGMNDNDPDIDDDGFMDGDELELGTDPFDEDSDDDGLTDGEEVNMYGSDPRFKDSDGDGFGDGDEVSAGYNPAGSGTL